MPSAECEASEGTQQIIREHSDNMRKEILIRYKEKKSDGNRLPRQSQELPSFAEQGLGHYDVIESTLSLGLDQIISRSSNRNCSMSLNFLLIMTNCILILFP